MKSSIRLHRLLWAWSRHGLRKLGQLLQGGGSGRFHPVADLSRRGHAAWAVGRLGERVAARFLRDNGCRILAVNYREKEVEIDLVVRDGDVLAFVEVKARDIRCPTPPGMAVDSAKRRRMARGALLYLRRLEYPRISWRFDIVEVWCEQGRVRAIRHLPDAFAMTAPCPYYGKSGADPTPRPGSDGTSRRSS